LSAPSLGNGPRLSHGPVRQRENLLCLLKECLSGGRELQLPSGAVEQRSANLFFQVLDLAAQRRLLMAPPRRRAAEVERFSDRHEIA
jgi:hypothetical protein